MEAGKRANDNDSGKKAESGKRSKANGPGKEAEEKQPAAGWCRSVHKPPKSTSLAPSTMLRFQDLK